MTIAKPTVLAFYADSKCIKYLPFIVNHPKLIIWKKLPEFEKRRNTPQKASDLIENPFVRYIISENPNVKVSSSNLQNVNFCIAFQIKKNMVDAHLFVLLFTRSDQTDGLR